jgi:hypothetical protein
METQRTLSMYFGVLPEFSDPYWMTQTYRLARVGQEHNSLALYRWIILAWCGKLWL